MSWWRGGGWGCTTLARRNSPRDVAGTRRRYPLPAMMNGTGRRSYLRRVAGEGRALAGAEPGGGDARHGPLGGVGRRRVDERRAVAKGGAHHARLTAQQLLVHVQSHRGRRVRKAQRRAGEGGKVERSKD